MAKKARVAVIGSGWWSSVAHIPTLQAHPDAELVAICDSREDTLSRAAEAFDIDTTYTDYRELLENEELDGAIIAVWHAAHYETARACLERDLHVMVEKPMVLTAVHARHLVELARQRERELIVGYPYHFAPRVLRAREVVQSGELGEIQYINNVFASTTIDFLRGDEKPYADTYGFPVHGPTDVYSDPARSGGGQGHLQITHSGGLMHFVTGLRPVSVMALMNAYALKVDLVDAITARMDNGALANIGSTGNLQVSDPGILALQVNCERGRIDFEFITGAGHIRHADGSDELLERLDRRNEPEGGDQPADLYPFHATATNLVDVINGKAANGSPGEIGWRTVELLDAAYRSAASEGRAVSVESLYE
jgi:predicted dehydrogenase